MLAVLGKVKGTSLRTMKELAAGLAGVRLMRGGLASVDKVRVNSASVRPGDVFVAIPGARVDGAHFVPDAIHRGAAAIVTSPGVEPPEGPAWMVAEDPRHAAALLAACAWDHPSRQLDAVGFTGTNGKTTSAFLLAAIARAAGRKVAVLGTLGAYLPDGRRPQDRTTPEAPELQATLAEAVNQGADIAAIEVSSHALDLRRVDGVSFAAAAFLNLSPEHLDWHKTMEDYGVSKMRLFAELLAAGPTPSGRPRAALHRLDPWAGRFRGVVEAALFFAAGDEEAEVTARGLRIAPAGSTFELRTPDGTAHVELALPGAYNVTNALAAASVAWSLGIETDVIATGLSAAIAPPGRFERVHAGAFDVYVDYAHTEDGLVQVLEVARQITKGRLVVVLGCGGDRDTEKRPIMGRLAAEAADRVVFTSDNPRNEDPAVIVDAMLRDVADRSGVDVILDRAEALESAVALAGAGDVVLALGKGHETYQEIAGTKHDFPEREILTNLSRRHDGGAE